MSTVSRLHLWDIFIRRYSIPLIAGIAVGLTHANASPQSYHYLFGSSAENDADHFVILRGFKLFGEYQISLPFLINDCFMLFFFGFVLKHVIESLIPPNGSMYPLKRALPPIISSCFGVMCPIFLYLSFITILESINSEKWSIDTLINGWAIPISTDVALSWTVATFIFNDHLDHNSSSINNKHEMHPCISFLLLLAIFDDIIGLIVIAVFYKEKGLTTRPIFMLIVVGASVAAFISNYCLKIQKWWFYIFILGGISWIGFLLTAIHPALALIPIMPFMLINNDRKKTLSSLSHVQYNYIHENDESELEMSGIICMFVTKSTANKDKSIKIR